SAFADLLVGSSGSDTIAAGGGDDVITGGAGVDVIRGGDGNDTIRATVDDGNDVYDGGAGIDTVDYSAISTGLNIDLNAEDRSGTPISGAPWSFADLMAAAGLAASTPVGLARGSQIGTDVLTGIE